ncbi:hypothetical protein A6V36_32305 [Paraburkholderia ginsengiterrae]|uniref:Uncharacterized protein n=1 Tax=Paraburkholderia ginsengiterrae TaxID=1462993 RepID=A0A1A9N8G1_9BURK|nr:hypothetical protein [Paraburkholderia ginsengiterrae]OAJ57118.1 hypothetical protein A6V36_32305 [Paraburkholderia ginsengiterrae]OAJ61343.1 hypothetical protein A6V37_25345 [Paraburkholderia ginsengiterrae]
MFHYLDKYALDGNATKAIFEHFRNLLTAAAILAAGQWLSKHGMAANVHGLVKQPDGGVLSMIGIGLIVIAVMNAQVKMLWVGYKGLWIVLMWAVHIGFAVGGLFAYSMLH